ncbi:putative lysosomal cobalamin transporter [Chamberlinius hualienensis]
MDVPSWLIAAGWIPFTVVVVLTLLFAVVYISYFKSRYDRDRLTTFVSVWALAIAFYTLFLIPVDVFLVSFMKDDNGTFRDWATDNLTRQSIEDHVLTTYYVLYGCMGSFIFLIIPFVYFLYEEGDEITTCSSRVCGALKYTVAFLLFAAILIIIGSVIPLRGTPPVNSTEFEKFQFIISELGENKGEDILSFVVSVLTVIGLVLFIVFGGYGLSALPIGLIKGLRSIKYDIEELQERKLVLSSKASLIRDKYPGGRQMSSRDQSRLYELEEEIRLLDRRERVLSNASRNWFRKCLSCCRPLEMIGGVAMVLLGLLLFISLLLTNIDKAMHSLGPKSGYVLPTRQLPNPIDIVLVYAENVFPLDYVLFTTIILFLFFCTMSAMQKIGIWFLWIRMYRIRPGRTKPQGLLMMCMTLMLVILGISVVIYSVTPQYIMYGSQQYWDGIMLKPCSTAAPPDECILSRVGMLLVRLGFKAWFFGAVYYWGTWVLLGVIVLGSLVSMFKRRGSLLDGGPNSDDFDESDEELLRM